MKKTYSLMATSLIAVSLLAACGAKKQATPASKSSSSSTSTSVVSSSQVQSSITMTTTSEPSSTTEPSSSTAASQPVASAMNVDEVAQGNYASIIGTWRNSAGYELTFDENGLAASIGLELGQYGDFSSGVFAIGVSSIQDKTGFALIMIPQGTIIPDSLFGEGNDTSDTNRDRMVGTQSPLSGATLDPYYRVTE